MNAKECHSMHGLTQRQFAHFVFAAAALLLAGAGGCSKSPEDVKAEKATHVAQTTGRLVVKSNRANTTIEATRINAAGEAAPGTVKGAEDGAAEHALAGFAPGRYAVIARSAGWPDLREEATVDAGRTTEVAIQFKSGSLRVDSVPTGATVKFGRSVLGKTPLVVPQLPPGELSLTLEYPLWPALPFKTTITEKVETTETVRLPHGKLTVETTPPGATVFFGKRAIGQTPLTIERYQAGTTKLTMQAKDFPPLEVSVTVEDRSEVKINPALGSAFPVLDPDALLRAVWVPDDPNRIAPPFDGMSGPSAPRNGIVKNLQRKRLLDYWLRKNYHFAATVKAFDPEKGQVEFDEQKGDLSRYRVLARLSAEARNDQNLTAQLIKGATFGFYGRLSAVEEPRWPAKVITFEISEAEPLR